MSHPERVIRWAVLISWLAYCGISGGIRGMFYGFVGFGLLCVLWYTIIDTWHRLTGHLSHPKVMVDARSVNVFQDDVQARRGAPVQRETTEDFAGMIEYRKGGGVR